MPADDVGCHAGLHCKLNRLCKIAGGDFNLMAARDKFRNQRGKEGHVRRVSEIDPEAIQRLKEEPGKDMLIYGSASIVQQLASLGLIDEYQLLVHPVTVGGGKPLFKAKHNLKFVSAQPFTSGVVLLTYRT